MAKVCPKCGSKSFLVLAHVTQEWLVDGAGDYLHCTEERVEVTHKPDEQDVWTCFNCCHEAEGSKLEEAIVSADMQAEVLRQLADNSSAQIDLLENGGGWKVAAHIVVTHNQKGGYRVSLVHREGGLFYDAEAESEQLGFHLLKALEANQEVFG